ncbi:MAG: hypothetical protein JW939_03290 [Candidatus Thermoplasmatota archaeon]|nr:hypothetical protein [Candidatus Thermoplasmatota archaeon]
MIWARYDEKWTRLSFDEMINFSRWMNDLIGYFPTIVGGWAVFMYNQRGFGSRDIDVVIPTREMKGRVIDRYLMNNGYQVRKKAFGEMEWIKELEPGNPSSETYLDVCTLEDRNIVHGTDIEIPWKIAHDHQVMKELDGTMIYVPSPEALLILKVKAAWDRNHDIQIGGGTPFLQDKVRKDRFDIVSILKSCSLEKELTARMVNAHHFEVYFKDAVARAISDRESIVAHGLSDDDLFSLEKKVSSLLLAL